MYISAADVSKTQQLAPKQSWCLNSSAGKEEQSVFVIFGWTEPYLYIGVFNSKFVQICCMKHLESVTCFTGMMWLMLLPWTFVVLEDFAWKRFLIQSSLSEDILIRRWITAECVHINNYVELLSKDSAQKAARLVSLSPQTALRFRELPPAALYS